MLINERKEAEYQKRKYIHLLERIAFIVAHNVRGPLCSILGLSNLLQEFDELPKDAAIAVGYLKESAQKLDAITQTLSKFVYDNEIEIRLKEYHDESP